MRKTMHEEIHLMGRKKSPTKRQRSHSASTNRKSISSTYKLTLDEDNDLDLPDESENVETILAEMEAQKALFDVVFQSGSLDRALSRVREALELLPENPEKFETRLLVFCLNHCLGNIREDLIPTAPTKTKWSQRAFEALAIGWMHWMTNGDKGVLLYISRMSDGEPEEDDKAVETLSLNFWAKAIEMLVIGRSEDARRFFERANEVGANYGTRMNPSICWTYATSFFMTS
jgi:tetratricopeptide (TPR) repeat protein